jgi:hypothetical protein
MTQLVCFRSPGIKKERMDCVTLGKTGTKVLYEKKKRTIVRMFCGCTLSVSMRKHKTRIFAQPRSIFFMLTYSWIKNMRHRKYQPGLAQVDTFYTRVCSTYSCINVYKGILLSGAPHNFLTINPLSLPCPEQRAHLTTRWIC